VRERRSLDAVLAGVLAGVSIMSKYFSVVALLTLFAATFTVRAWRDFYTSRAFPIVLVAFCVTISPHLLWLQRNGYVTIGYFEHAEARDLGHLMATTLSFSLAQALWLTPMALGLGFCLAHERLRWRDLMRFDEAPERLTFAILFCGPFALTLLLAWGTFSRLTPPWGIPLWFAAATIVVTARIGVADINFPRLIAFVAIFYFAALGVSPAIRVGEFMFGKPASLEPRRMAAVALTELWHRATSRPLRHVAGSKIFSRSATFYSSDHPSEFTEFDWAKAPWVTPEQLRRDGLAIVCNATDRSCLDTAQSMFGDRAERTEVTLHRSFLRWAGPPSTLVFMIVRPTIQATIDPPWESGHNSERGYGSPW
jgi:hypothetical protein